MGGLRRLQLMQNITIPIIELKEVGLFLALQLLIKRGNNIINVEGTSGSLTCLLVWVLVQGAILTWQRMSCWWRRQMNGQFLN